MEKCSDNNEDVTKAILAFDTLYTTNHMKIFKLLLPYLKPEQQKPLAIYIKWQELLFTLNFFKQYSDNFSHSDSDTKKNLDLKILLPLLTPYCNESEKAILSQFSQMQNMMHMIEDMQQYMPLIQQIMSGENDINEMFHSTDNNMMDMLKNMMSKEQQEMFSMFMDNNL